MFCNIRDLAEPKSLWSARIAARAPDQEVCQQKDGPSVGHGQRSARFRKPRLKASGVTDAPVRFTLKDES